MPETTDNTKIIEPFSDKYSDNDTVIVGVYTAIMSNSNVDRTDIVYIGTDRNKAIDALWKNYKDFYADGSPENGKYKKKDFIKAVEQDHDSAYIQFSRSHINFELHKNNVELNKDACIAIVRPDK